MKGVTYHEDWSSGCQGSSSTKAMDILAGTQWGEVYAEMTKHDVNLIGGNALTVGAAGGCPLAACHGTNSPLYGLTADNILEMDVVTADGTLLTVNEC